MSTAGPQTTRAPSKPQPKLSTAAAARTSKDKSQQPKEMKPVHPTPVANAKDKENVTNDTRKGRHSLPAPSTSSPPDQQKKITRRSSKPIFDWFQRKLAGTVRARRASESARAGRAHGGTATSRRDKTRPPLPDNFHGLTRTLSTPSRGRSSGERNVRRRSHAADSPGPQPMQATVSLDDEDSVEDRRENSTYRSSLARESLWSPTSNLEADEDASVRPLPPSSPPSPSPSRSSSSYLSDPRTFRSLAASTKPTTLLSVDLTGGMAHIAQAPPTPSSTFRRLHQSHTRTTGGSTSSTNPIQFAMLPTGHSPSASVSGETSSHQHHLSPAPPVQAPQLTHYHPRNNPRPSSPPPDDASVLTLASSAFGIPGARPPIVASADAMSVSQFSHFGGSRGALEDRSSHFVLGDDFEADRDGDASMRALRPRSSRRGSWESEASGWSAKMGVNSSTVALGPGTPLHDRSLFWAASVKTGDFDDAASVGLESSQMTEASPSEMQSTTPLLDGAPDSEHLDIEHELNTGSSMNGTVPRITGDVESDEDVAHDSMRDIATPRHALAELVSVEAPLLPTSLSTTSADSGTTAEPVPRAVDSEDSEGAETEAGAPSVKEELDSEDVPAVKVDEARDETYFALPSPPPSSYSLAQSETTDVFVSAPSTPLPVTPAAA